MSRLVGLACVVTVIVLGIPATSSAESWAGRDPAGDVSGVRVDPDPNASCGVSVTAVEADVEPNEDIRALRVRYSPSGLRVVVRLRKLDPDLEQRFDAVVRTPRGPWSLDVSRTETRPGSGHFRTSASWSRIPVRQGECGYISTFQRVPGAVDFDTDRVTATVPARVLRDARWVRVKAAAGRSFRTPGVEPTEDGFYSYTSYTDRWSGGKFGPRIRVRPGVVS